MSLRREQSRIASATSATGLTVGCNERSSEPAGTECVYAGICPDVRTASPVLAELEVVCVWCVAVLEHTDEFMLRAIKRALACICLYPHHKILQFGVDLLACRQHLGMSWRQSMQTNEFEPLAECLAASDRQRKRKRTNWSGDIFARPSHEFTVPDLSAALNRGDEAHVIGRVGKDHRSGFCPH